MTVLRFTFTALALSAMLLATETSHAEEKAATPNWYLVDDIIEDEAPDYRTDIFFADKASIKREDGYISISISQIIMSQGEGPSDRIIRDLRSRIMIDCNEHMYAATEVSKFDQDNKMISSKIMPLETAEWELPFANSGYVSVFRFACEPDIEFGSQEFPADIQPLTSIMAYLKADWRN